MAALYADENFSYPVVAFLRLAGHDILTAPEDGRANQGIDDPDVLDRAIGLGRAVLLFNRLDYRDCTGWCLITWVSSCVRKIRTSPGWPRVSMAASPHYRASQGN